MMHCSNCEFHNPDGMKYCGQCGQPLKLSCSRCGFENPPNFNFCGQCGAALGIRNEKLEINEAGSPALRIEAERRQLTVMFCDLVGSTALSEQLDPEDLRDVIRAYQQTAAQVIGHYAGYVAQYLGDGILVYFGYPQAHENDARRAVLAGLDIIEEMKNLTVELGQTVRTTSRTPLNLAIRVGVHTGLVVVGEVGGGPRREQLALGETTNIAARLQGLARPNTLLISAATHRLAAGFFACRPLGFQSLKGISRPLETYRVLRKSRARDRLDAAEAVKSGLTPLVGRDEEMDLLLARWQQAQEGQGQIVLLGGEAGIGKSRLARVFRERLSGQPHLWFSCHGSAYYQHTALYPIVELLQRLLRFKKEDSLERKINKLEAALQQYGLPLAETAPLFTDLFSFPLPDRYQPLKLTPQSRKQKMVQAFLSILLKLTGSRPVVILVEDLHWVDPSTLEMLGVLVDQVSKMRSLVLFTFRPEFSPPWSARSYLTRLTLNRLPHPQAERLIRSVAGGKSLPSELLDQIIAKTDGVPIFMEELTKMILDMDLLLEQDDRYHLVGPLPRLAIPSTLHDSLMARLDRLADCRELAQLAAVLGREFSYRLLQAVAKRDELTLQSDLTQLVEAELLNQLGLLQEAVYSFKHALVQETAYRSLLRRKRQMYHQLVAEVLAEQFPEAAQNEPELLAHHYTAARRPQEAVLYWQLAGQRAVSRSANLEAIIHFNQALELLEFLPESGERSAQELQLRVALGAPLLMTKGYTAPEVEANYARARELSQQLAETPHLAAALFGLWVFYLVQGRYQTALEIGRQLMQLARQPGNQSTLIEAHQVQGINFFNLAELKRARDHLEQALEIYTSQPHQAKLLADSSTDHGVACLSHLALTLWLLGYPEQALARSQAAIELAERLAHPYSLSFALCWAAWLRQLRSESEHTLKLAERSRNIAVEQGFSLLELIDSIMVGWALTEQGQLEAGVEQIRACVTRFEQTGAQLGQLHFRVLLADVYHKTDQIDRGLAIATTALGQLATKGERFYEAELLRLKGELLLKKSSDDATDLREAEGCFRQAIEVAHRRGVLSLELRATISLSRLRLSQARRLEARQLLQAIHKRFEEGFDTADLQAAKALLETT